MTVPKLSVGLAPRVQDGVGDLPFRSAFWIEEAIVLRAKAEHAAESSVTELLYAPIGPNAADELRRFATMLAGA